MLSTLRHKGVSRTILWATTIIIILSFGIFGISNRLDHTIHSAGKIFGKNITVREFQKAYLDSKDQAVLTYGERFLTAGANFDLEREAFARLILMTEVKKRKIRVSDKEVVEFIASIPFFQRAGAFDPIAYTMLLKNPGIFGRAAKDFEDGVRDTLSIRKMLESVAGPVVVTEDDLKKEYIKRHEKIKLQYALLSPDNFKTGLGASAEEIQKFYNDHKESFRQPPMVNVQYVHLMYPEKADDAQKSKVKNEAIAISHELTPKASFADVAKKHAAELKESGYFTQDQPLLTFAWSPEFVDKIFAMKLNEVSSPMEAPDGWQIIKIKSKKDTQVPALNEITTQVKEAMLNQKAYDLAKAKAEKTLPLLEAALKTSDFKTASSAQGLSVDETESFSRGEYINAPGLIAEFQEESFKLNNNNKLSDIVSTSQGPAILYLSHVDPIDESKFTQDKTDFRNMVEAQRRNQAINAFVTKLTLDAKLTKDIKDKVRYQER